MPDFLAELECLHGRSAGNDIRVAAWNAVVPVGSTALITTLPGAHRTTPARIVGAASILAGAAPVARVAHPMFRGETLLVSLRSIDVQPSPATKSLIQMHEQDLARREILKRKGAQNGR